MTSKYGALSKGCKNHDKDNDADWYLSTGTLAHLGIDISRGDGQSVHAIADGTVRYAGTAWGSSWGHVVVVEHGTVTSERFLAVYAHLYSDTIKSGTITKGTKVGRVVTTGTGPHLHFGLVPGPWTGTVPPGSVKLTPDANGNCTLSQGQRSSTVDGRAWLTSRTPNGVLSTSTGYRVRNTNSGKCVDAAGGGTSNGTRIQQYTCNSTTAQKYKFIPTGSGYYKLVRGGTSDQVIDIQDRSTANGAKAHLWTYVGGTNQQWKPVYLGKDRWRFVARHSGRCLDVPGASKNNSVQLHQYECNGTAAQSFTLTL